MEPSAREATPGLRSATLALFTKSLTLPEILMATSIIDLPKSSYSFPYSKYIYSLPTNLNPCFDIRGPKKKDQELLSAQ